MIKPFRVTFTHPDLSGECVADLKASSPEMAEKRLRMTLMHQFRHAELMEGGNTTVVEITEAQFAA
jgi:hypothetical protein